MDLELARNLAIPLTFLALVTVEWLFPARPLPRRRGWRILGVIAFAVTGVVASSVPMMVDGFIRDHRLLDLSGLPLAPATVVGLLVTELGGYWGHRLRHTRALWRVHQLHHSAERLDVFGGALFHPLDIAFESLLGALASTLLLGLAPPAAALAGTIAVMLSLFQHTNVRTPRWLGYVVQRPESHSVHHARGVHAFNYCDLPLWDLVFGTFRNPARFEPEQGFYHGASSRLGAMLLGRDVSERPASSSSAGALTSA